MGCKAERNFSKPAPNVLAVSIFGTGTFHQHLGPPRPFRLSLHQLPQSASYILSESDCTLWLNMEIDISYMTYALPIG